MVSASIIVEPLRVTVRVGSTNVPVPEDEPPIPAVLFAGHYIHYVMIHGSRPIAGEGTVNASLHLKPRQALRLIDDIAKAFGREFVVAYLNRDTKKTAQEPSND